MPEVTKHTDLVTALHKKRKPSVCMFEIEVEKAAAHLAGLDVDDFTHAAVGREQAIWI